MIKEPKAAEPRWYLKIELENTIKIQSSMLDHIG